jgi:hypothetical protein
MDCRLFKLICRYQSAVKECVEALVEIGASRPNSIFEWTTSDFARRGKLKDGRDYMVHGFGCAVRSKGRSVDFDFGEHGEIDGFDEWRLGKFLGSNPRKFGFNSIDEMRSCFQAAKEAGEFIYSGYTLYYLNAQNADAPGSE